MSTAAAPQVKTSEIKTGKVKGRRKLRYNSLDEILADAERMVAVHAPTVGNWSKGQIFRHLAELMHASIDGFPFQPPWFAKVIGRLTKPYWLRFPMPAGIQLPRKRAAKFIPDPQGDEEGLAFLRETIARMRREPKRVPSPLIGKLSTAQWEQFHCRHAELHMSFIVPEASR